MSKKSKKVEPAAPAVTKKERVRLILVETPSSVTDIATKLDISKAAAYSLIGDLRRDGAKITGVLKDGAMVYSVVVAAQPERAKPFGLKRSAPIDV